MPGGAVNTNADTGTGWNGDKRLKMAPQAPNDQTGRQEEAYEEHGRTNIRLYSGVQQ